MNSKLKNILIVIGIPTVYAVILRLFFGIERWNELFSVMSVTFLFCLPIIVGGLTIYLSDKEQVEKLWYRILAPWIPIFLFLIITLAFAIEGWACWCDVLIDSFCVGVRREYCPCTLCLLREGGALLLFDASVQSDSCRHEALKKKEKTNHLNEKTNTVRHMSTATASTVNIGGTGTGAAKKPKLTWKEWGKKYYLILTF